MRALVNGTELYFDVDGSGLVAEGPVMRERPIAFLSHGGPGADHTSFKPGYSPLSQHMQLVFYDHRGHGRSGRSDQSLYNLDQNVEDLEALRRYLGLDQVVSVGGSYGGMVATAHAARYPTSVSKLILVATAAHGGFISRAQQLVDQRATAEQREAVRRLWAGELTTVDDIKYYYDVMGPLYSTTHDPSKSADATKRATHEPAPMAVAFQPGGFLRTFDLRHELDRITATTLVIGARHDWICAPEFSKELADLIPNAHLEIFEDSGHFVRADEPDRLINLIKQFVLDDCQ